MKKFAKILVMVCITGFSYTNANAESYIDDKVIAHGIIDRPLQVGSKEWKNEINHIVNLQRKAQAEEVSEALEERTLTSEMVAEYVDPKLTRKDYPALYKLLDNSLDTSELVASGEKAFWNTNRPFLSDKKVKALIEAHNNGAYPSGHTSGSHVLAYVLGMLMPERRQDFYDRANEIANHRILVGMHFPHDIRGGKQLSLLVTGALLEDRGFQKDFVRAKKEIIEKAVF